jgi:hypothetical protein
MENKMAKVENINVTLDKLANYTVTTHNDVTGQVANDFFTTDVARTLVNVPIYAAKNKRAYCETLLANVMANTIYDEDQKIAHTQTAQYYQAKERFERLSPKIEREAIVFDHIADSYKAWFKEFTGQDYDLPRSGAAKPAISKADQKLMDAIKERVAAA